MSVQCKTSMNSSLYCIQAEQLRVHTIQKQHKCDQFEQDSELEDGLCSFIACMSDRTSTGAPGGQPGKSNFMTSACIL